MGLNRDFRVKTGCSCDSEGSEGPRGKKVLYSGVTDDRKPFRHVKGCYCGEKPVEPLLRLISRGCQKTEKRREAPPCGVQRVAKVGRCRNAQTQTSEIAENSKASSTQTDSFATAKKLGELRDFRKENYFETHFDSGGIPAHKCVHKFTINERFLQEPVHSDAYGISRCAICWKPLESPAVATTARSRSPENRRKSVEIAKKKYEYRLKQPSVNIGTGREVMKISVPQNFERECFEEGVGFKLSRRQMAPFESLALRYQKGVV